MIVSIYGHNYQLEDQQLRPHFSLKEVANNKGDAKLPQFVIDEKSDLFLDMLEELRCWFARPITVSSVYRQSAYNLKVKGDPKSAHLHACAMDWLIKGHTEQQRQNVINEWKALCKKHNVIGAINLYTGGYHVEIYSDKWYGQKSFAVRDYRGVKGKDW